jgi:glycosyltransferase involved in cell wall biosynthesis
MRVLVLSTWPPYPPNNGSKIRAHYLVRALSEKHEVTLIAFRPHNMPIAEPPNNVSVVNVATDPFRHVNLSQLLKYASPIPLAFWPSRAMRQAVDDAARASRWDAVVAIQTPVAQYASRIRQAARILDVDTSFSYQMYRRHNRSSGIRTWLSWQKTQGYEARCFRRFDTCTVVSSEEVSFVQSMVKDTPCRIEVIPNGVDAEYHRPGLAVSRPDTLIYNGALTYSANYDAMQYFLADIYPRLKCEIPTVTLTITGSTEGINQSGLQLDENVHFSGEVPDIRQLMSGSAVCVAPIRQGSGTRLKILEAMALGVPVVSTSQGAEGLDVADGQHLLIADDPAEFVVKTQAALHDIVLRERLIVQARQLVEHRYDWRIIGQQFVRLVESAAGNVGRNHD